MLQNSANEYKYGNYKTKNVQLLTSFRKNANKFKIFLYLNVFGKVFAQEQKSSSKELTLSQYIYIFT